MVGVASSLAATGCGTDLTKYDLAYLACSEGLGFNQAGVDNLWQRLRGYRSQGVSFEDAVVASIQACGSVFGSDDTGAAGCRACVGLIAEGVYNSDGSGPSAVNQGPQIETINLKMPLPGNYAWRLTIEAGGQGCLDNWVDPGHQNLNYFSLDFDDTSLTNGKVQSWTDVPVYPATNGLVVFSSATEDPYNGFYVVIDHDGDGNLNTGFSTRYLHLAGVPLVKAGTTIGTNIKLGFVGNTGEVIGESHLHFGVRYQNKGSGDIPQLQQSTIEGHRISDYKCDRGSSQAGYYLSSNTP